MMFMRLPWVEELLPSSDWRDLDIIERRRVGLAGNAFHAQHVSGFEVDSAYGAAG